MMKRFFLAFLLATAIVGPARAASVLPQTLAQIIDASTLVFQGTCTGNRTERDAATNFVVTYTTFTVKEVLKGSVGMTHTIKQIGGTLDDGRPVMKVEGVPTFTVGEEYVVFLAGVSNLGFSSPIGLSQGKFSVKQGAAGQVVTNGRDFRDMAPGMPTLVLPPGNEPSGHMGLNAFKQAVRDRTGGTP